MSKNTIIIVVIILIAIAGVFYFTNKKADAPIVVAPDTNTPVSTFEQKGICYFKATVGNEATDNAFTSINYDEGNKVHGIINWIPEEKDSLVGTYTGVVEKNEGMEAYPTRLNIIYSGWGEGILSKQQQIILVGANDIKTGTGEMYQDKDGSYKLKDITRLTYDIVLPKVDCSSVIDRLKADYSKAS